jgi:hypothetical protein
MWGDPTRAIQATYAVFQNLGLTIARNAVSLSTGLISREPVTGIALPDPEEVEEIPSIPIAPRSWSFYLDTAWANLGTSKLLAAYEGGVSAGDKYTPDWTVNAALASFNELLEAESTDYTANLRLGFDANAVAMIADYKASELKFLRFQSIGPLITGTTFHELTVDFCFRVTDPGEFGPAPGSPAVTVPFNGQLTVDPVSGFASTARLVNKITSL